VIAAREAAVVLIGAIINASAVARKISEIGQTATLLCAGTRGEPAMEDLLGAGAVIDALMIAGAGIPATDTAHIALRFFRASKSSLRETMADAAGGRHVLAVGLGADINFCAALDSIPLVGRVLENPLRVSA
jgi:2-phosphosulfolactate phosphatase